MGPKTSMGLIHMASSTTTGFSIAVSARATPSSTPRSNRRRRIDPQSGRALEILGHAIEYLTDELVQSRELVAPKNAQVEAIQLLMALNRQVYFECPEVPTLVDRFRAFLRLRSA